jgi:hypothetical protein
MKMTGTGVAMLAVLCGTAGIAQAGDDETLKEELASIEQALWGAWAINDKTVIKARGRDDTVLIMATGRERFEDFADDPSGGCEVFGYSLGDFEVVKLTDDAAALSYRAEQDATCEGQKLPSPVMVSSVYAREDGMWKWVMYHESPLIEDAAQ